MEDARALCKALKSIKFPRSFKKRVKLSKINRAVMLQWIETNIAKSLGFEDEIVTSTAVNLFLPEVDAAGSRGEVEMDPRRAQIDLAGFLGDEQAASFAKNLWELLLDAQTTSHGIPTKLMEDKKEELARAKREEQEQQNHNWFVQEASRRAESARQASLGGRRHPPSHNIHRDEDRGERGYSGGSHGRSDRDSNYHHHAHGDEHRHRHRRHDRGHPPYRYGRYRSGEDGDRRLPPRQDYPWHVSPPHPPERSEREMTDRKMPPDHKRTNEYPPPAEDEFGRAIMPKRDISASIALSYNNSQGHDRERNRDGKQSNSPLSRKGGCDRNSDEAGACYATDNSPRNQKSLLSLSATRSVYPNGGSQRAAEDIHKKQPNASPIPSGDNHDDQQDKVAADDIDDPSVDSSARSPSSSEEYFNDRQRRHRRSKDRKIRKHRHRHESRSRERDRRDHVNELSEEHRKRCHDEDEDVRRTKRRRSSR